MRVENRVAAGLHLRAGRRRRRLDRGAGAARRRGEPLAAGADARALRRAGLRGPRQRGRAGAARADARSRPCPRGWWRSRGSRASPCPTIVRDMLLHSTNLTAEVAGPRGERGAGAVARDPRRVGRRDEPTGSRETTGARVRLVDHSGLGGDEPGRGAGDGPGARPSGHDGPAAAPPEGHRADGRARARRWTRRRRWCAPRPGRSTSSRPSRATCGRWAGTDLAFAYFSPPMSKRARPR